MHRILISSTAGLLAGLFVCASTTETQAAPQGKHKSNRRFVTFSQVDWGPAAHEGGPAARFRNDSFKKAFPDGLTIGSKRKGGVQCTILTAKALAQLLPIEGKSRTMLTGNVKGARNAGAIAGQLVAAKMNVAFNDLGLLPDKLGRHDGDVLLASMVFKDNVHRKLQGVSVRRLIRLSDRALSGRLGRPNSENKPLVDVDRNGTPEISLADLRQALYTLNRNYRLNSQTENSLEQGPPKEADDGPVGVGTKRIKPKKPGVVPVPKKVDPPRTTPGKIKVKPGDPKINPTKTPSDRTRLLTQRNQEIEKLKTFYLEAMKQAKAQAAAKGEKKIPAEVLERLSAEYQASTDKVNAKYKALDGARKLKPDSKVKPTGTPKQSGDDG